MYFIHPDPVRFIPTYSLSLSHRGDGLKVPDSDVLNLGGDLTIEAWIKPSLNLQGSFHYIVSKNYGGTGYALLLIGNGDNVRLQFEARDTVAYFIPLHILADRWWHVAGVFRANHDLSMFLNGIQVAHRDTNLAMQSNNLPLYIGTSLWDSFQGQVADVRIWNQARTQDQILDNMTRERIQNQPGLVGNWTFKRLSRGRSYDQTLHTKPAMVEGNPVKVILRTKSRTS